MAKEHVHQLPVVSEGQLQGVISRGDVLRVLKTREELHVECPCHSRVGATTRSWRTEMRLLVFGASGRVGERLVAEAVEQGHDVTTFGRLCPSAAKGERLRALTGVMRDRGLLESALAGQDAVIWTPGGVFLETAAELSDDVRTMTAAMELLGPRRLVFLSSLGEAETRRRGSLFSAVFLLRLFGGYMLRESETQERYVRASTLEWTIVRAGTLFDGPWTGTYRLGFGVADVPADAKISYADAAVFMLRQVTDAAYVRATVGVFY
jgi:putative NADH-flavin reductase